MTLKNALKVKTTDFLSIGKGQFQSKVNLGSSAEQIW